jgi:hypothetical protein
MVIQTVALLVAATAVLWLIKGDGSTRIAAFVSPPRSAPLAAVPSPASAEPACQPIQDELIGAFYGCASRVVEALVPCMAYPSNDRFSGLAHLEMNGRRFMVFLSVDGGYHGAATYPLVPWPNSPWLEAHDGVAKVLVQETGSRTYWQSTAGSLTIDSSGDSGSMFADLGFFFTRSARTPTSRKLKIDGPWRCSSGLG